MQEKEETQPELKRNLNANCKSDINTDTKERKILYGKAEKC